MHKLMIPKAIKHAGFTLIELIVVMTVAAIILAVATPSFMNIIADNRVSTAATEVVTVLNLGKSEAVRTGQTIVLCKRAASDTQCAMDTSIDWSNGWLLFVDSDGSNQQNDGERIIRVESLTETSLDIAYDSSTASNRMINFNPNGRIAPNGRFCFRNQHDDSRSRAVVISQTGRVHTETQAYSCT